MKKQLLALALLTLGYAATVECKKHQTYTIAANGGTMVINGSKKRPKFQSLPSGVTVRKTGDRQWTITNTGTTAARVTRKK